jgi:Fur family ferric uptake transcriptional regulator
MRKRAGMGAPWWKGTFRGRGYRLTIPRQAILEVLGKAEKHLSAEDVYLKVHKIYPNIGLTTVYRTLEILVQMGVISRFDFGDGRARYELVEGPEKEHHHHLICVKCKRVINYSEFMEAEKEFLKQVEKGLSKKYNFIIKNHVIQFYGLCDKCKKEEV